MVQPPPAPGCFAPGAGQAFRVLGNLVTVKAAGADTGGAYALFEAHTAPGQGMPTHLRRYDDEALFVLEGTYALRIGDETVELGAGGYAFVPRGTPHAYTNRGTGPARLLLLVSPGGIHEQFVADVGEPLANPAATPAPPAPAEFDKFAAAAPKYGIEVVPPLNL